MQSTWQDLRYAIRQLRKAPGFTFTAVLTLALGIGISAAMFTVVDAVLLRPLPVPHSSQIVVLGEASDSGGLSASSLPDLRDWRQQSKSFQDIAWYTQSFFDLKKPDGSAQFSINTETSPNFFSMLQARPLLGRTFLPQGTEGENAGVVVLSYYVWRNNFHGNKDILGQTIQLGSNPYQVVGVMPPRFYVGINDDGPIVWTVLTRTPSMENRGSAFLRAIGRLRTGVTVASATAELNGIQGNIAQRYENEDLPKSVVVKSYLDALVGPVRPALLALLGAVLLVWLIACANIAGLMLTRMAARRREIAVRAALGAAIGRIVRQFLTESLLLGVSGGVIGLGVAYGCLALLRRSIDASLGRSADIALNGHVILLLIVLSIVSAVIFGTAPAFQAASADPQEALHEGSRGGGAGVKQLRLRNALIIGEFALSLVLLVSAGLLLRTLYALRQVPLGFNPQHLITAQFFSYHGSAMMFSPAKDQADIRDIFYRPLLDRVQHIPGVESAALMTASPLTNNVHLGDNFAVIGEPLANASDRSVVLHAVTPGVYRTLETSLLEGRLFNQEDRIGTTAVVVVNQAFAHQYLGNQPLGKRLNLDLGPSTKSVLKDATVVGVVENTPQDALGQRPEPEVDIDIYQVPVGDDFYPIFTAFMQIVVRTKQQPQALIPTVSRVLAKMDTTFVVNNVQTMTEKIDSVLGSQRLAARLLWLFAMAAVLIAAAGLYGLLSYGVSQRTREIGVRLALGAQREDILGMVLRQAAKVLGAGLLLGILAAYFTEQLVRSFLYGVAPHDTLTLLAVSVLLVGVGLLASYLPARRAAKIEPVEALRTE